MTPIVLNSGLSTATMALEQNFSDEFNFCFPVPNILESERVALTPFKASEHAKLFIDQILPYPETFNYLPFGPFKDSDDFVKTYIETRVYPNFGNVLFAVWDKTKQPSPEASGFPGAFAGLIGLYNSSQINLCTEIACVLTLPPFHRTHVSSNAVGLLLQYALNLPSRQPGALGLRRVVWQANVLNAASIRLAERMQFKREGTLRWERVLPKNKEILGVGNGINLRNEDPRSQCVGRDTAMLGLCWDDWENGAKEKVEEIMRRRY